MLLGFSFDFCLSSQISHCRWAFIPCLRYTLDCFFIRGNNIEFSFSIIRHFYWISPTLELCLHKFVSLIFSKNISKQLLTSFRELNMNSVSYLVQNDRWIFRKEVLHRMILSHFLYLDTKSLLLFLYLFNVGIFLVTRIFHEFVVDFHMRFICFQIHG